MMDNNIYKHITPSRPFQNLVLWEKLTQTPVQVNHLSNLSYKVKTTNTSSLHLPLKDTLNKLKMPLVPMQQNVTPFQSSQDYHVPQSTLQDFQTHMSYLKSTQRGFNSGTTRFKPNTGNPLYSIDYEKPGPGDYQELPFNSLSEKPNKKGFGGSKRISHRPVLVENFKVGPGSYLTDKVETKNRNQNYCSPSFKSAQSVLKIHRGKDYKDMGPGHYDHGNIFKFREKRKKISSMFKSKSYRRSLPQVKQQPDAATYNLKHYISNNFDNYRGGILSPVFISKQNRVFPREYPSTFKSDIKPLIDMNQQILNKERKIAREKYLKNLKFKTSDQSLLPQKPSPAFIKQTKNRCEEFWKILIRKPPSHNADFYISGNLFKNTNNHSPNFELSLPKKRGKLLRKSHALGPAKYNVKYPQKRQSFKANYRDKWF